MAKTLQPLSDHLVVKALTREQVTASGIVLPETMAKERPEQGEVIAVGPGKIMDNGSRQALEVKVGDIVVFKKYGPDEVKIDDAEFLILSENDILAIIKG